MPKPKHHGHYWYKKHTQSRWERTKSPRSTLEILWVISVVVDRILYAWLADAGWRENSESLQWCYSQTLSLDSKLWILQSWSILDTSLITKHLQSSWTIGKLTLPLQKQLKSKPNKGLLHITFVLHCTHSILDTPVPRWLSGMQSSCVEVYQGWFLV